ncbi:hypothetical protein WJX81_001374 [Elliptochloris bilobata]|uniref:Uncharacterized protein n=1 Tax=Elliptochloris bilobata TaxID=381761 RepID=A0AAW1S9W3_9CHLO
MGTPNEELRKEDFEKAASDAKAKAAEFRQQTVDGANSLRQQAADGLGSLHETLKGKGDGSSTVDNARNKGAELVGAGKDKVEPSVTDKAKSTLQSVKEAVVPTAHAGTLTPEEQRQQARAHLDTAKDDMDKAGQHAASATQTVTHDIRSAADQAGQAASHLGSRFTASAEETGKSAADKASQAKDSAREGAEYTKDEAKSLYSSAKDTISGWLGGKEHVPEPKDDVDRAVEGTQDAISRNVHKAGDKVQGMFHGAKHATKGKAGEAHAKAPGAEEIKGEARSALDSAEDAAIRTKDAVVDTAKYIGGRLTAPIGGESEVEAGKRETREAADKAKAHGHGLVDRAREAYGDAKHQVSESVEDAKHRVSQTAEQAKQRAREAAERARPHTVEEAERAEGYPPSNTAALRASKAGLDREGQARAEAPTASKMEDKTRGALGSAGDLATRTKDAVVDSAKYIGGRLTAPVGGEESDTHGTVEAAKHDAHKTADKVADHGKGMVEHAKEAVGDAKARLSQAAEDAARSAQEAADSVRPHTAEEADLAQGLPPSNTADLLAERAAAPMDTTTSSIAGKARDAVQRLLKSARDGPLEEFKLAELAFPPVELAAVKEGHGRNALHMAALGGQTDICAYLVKERHLDTNAFDDQGGTPLKQALAMKQLATVDELLALGADARLSRGDDPTPVFYAAATGNIECLRAVLAHGGGADEVSAAGTPLLWAASAENVEGAKLLLEKGADPTSKDGDGLTALLLAAAVGNMELARLLLDAGADVNAKAHGLMTPLHTAAETGRTEIVNMLLEVGADPNAEDEAGARPIDAAATVQERGVVEALLPVTTPAPSEEHIDVPEAEEPDTDAATAAKRRGDEAFVAAKFPAAVEAYTAALRHETGSHALWANRSAALLRTGENEAALKDARIARTIDPAFTKAWYREGCAARELGMWNDAAQAFFRGYQTDPTNQELATSFQAAVERGKQAHAAAHANHSHAH